MMRDCALTRKGSICTCPTLKYIKEEIVEDGFGTSAPRVCPVCGRRVIYVCRPGDMRCSNCERIEYERENGIKKGIEIGRKGQQARAKFINHACEVCGKKRWVHLINGKPRRKRCQHCASIKVGGWKSKQGYIFIQLSQNDFFYPMTSARGRIFEHRLIMAKHLGRCLQLWEKVHHKNAVRDDNRLGNLTIVLEGSHNGKVRCPFCRKDFAIK